MKNLFILICFFAASAAQSQTFQFNGFPKDHASGQRLKGFTLEIYKNGVMVDKKEVKGRKVNITLEGQDQYWIRISKAGYEDLFFGSDLTNAPASKQPWKLDLPCELFALGTGQGNERICSMMVYDSIRGMDFQVASMNYGELKSKLKI